MLASSLATFAFLASSPCAVGPNCRATGAIACMTRDSTLGERSAGPISVSDVLEASLGACHSVTPLVSAVYGMVCAGGETAAKADGSLFTLADGLVQALLERLFAQLDAVDHIVAEEDSASLQDLFSWLKMAPHLDEGSARWPTPVLLEGL